MQRINHLNLSYLIWQARLKKDSWVIDATCGNGKDTLKLAKLTPQGGVIALDIQGEALVKTKELLGEELLKRVHLYQQSHEFFPSLAYKYPISLIVYNLGYLPGGNKELTTRSDVTLNSLKAALKLLAPLGLISITCYPGHPEGALEQKIILKMSKTLDPLVYEVYHYKNEQKPLAPSLLLINKNLNS